MLHPDYQYEPRLITALASLVASGVYDMAIGSRMLGKGALAGGMPRYKYVANRLLTAFQNMLIGTRLSEYHTGFRAFSRRVLETLPLGANSSDFVFDNQMLVQALALRHAHRRDLVPDALFRGREPDQLPALASPTASACCARASRTGCGGGVSRRRASSPRSPSGSCRRRRWRLSPNA